MPDKRFNNFLTKKFTEITGSVGLEEKPLHRIPFKFKEGTQSTKNGGFLNWKNLNSSNAIYVKETGSNVGYIGIKPSTIRTEIETFISNSFRASTFAKFSASFMEKLGDPMSALPTGEFVTIPAIDIPVTGSFNIKTGSYGRSGITNNEGKITFAVNNTSINNTLASWSFSNAAGTDGTPTLLITQTESIDQWHFEFQLSESYEKNIANAASIGKSYILSSSYSMNHVSGAAISNGILRYYNPNEPTNRIKDDGYYIEITLKGKVYGDGEYGLGEVSSSAFDSTTDLFYLPIKGITIFPSNSLIASGVFHLNTSSAESAPSSNPNLVTIYYISGSTGPSGSYSGSNNNHSGSHLFLDPSLKTAASSGYYAFPNPNSNIVFHAFKGGINGDITGSSVPSGQLEEFAPRWAKKGIIL
tara:strand:- start:6517 stop:7761 length:1245 start_codon:yes stop_codon:yes gene_type:complete